MDVKVALGLGVMMIVAASFTAWFIGYLLRPDYRRRAPRQMLAFGAVVSTAIFILDLVAFLVNNTILTIIAFIATVVGYFLWKVAYEYEN